MHIEVKDQNVEVKSGVTRNGARAGQGYEIHEQTAYLVTSDERKKLNLSLRKGQSPYASGRYVIADETFVVDQFGGLKIGRLQLTPAK